MPRPREGELRRLASIPKGKQHWNWNENPSVLTMHRRIHRKHGRAKNYKCEKCGRPAHDWALIGTAYSDKRKDYQTLCRSCHVSKDKNWIKVDRSHHKIIRDSLGRILRTIIT
jgi:NAD-dependent SIR2 family protein deacetylase